MYHFKESRTSSQLYSCAGFFHTSNLELVFERNLFSARYNLSDSTNTPDTLVNTQYKEKKLIFEIKIKFFMKIHVICSKWWVYVQHQKYRKNWKINEPYSELLLKTSLGMLKKGVCLPTFQI